MLYIQSFQSDVYSPKDVYSDVTDRNYFHNNSKMSFLFVTLIHSWV